MTQTTYSRRLLAITFLAFLMIGLPNGALNVAWIHMQATFGMSLDALGILLGAITLGRLVLSFYSGRLINRFGIGRFLLIGSLVMLAGLAMTAGAGSWPLLVFASLIFGIGSATLNTGINTFAAAHFNSGRMNWIHAWYGMGSALGPLLVTWLVIDLGQDWRWAYGVLVIIQLVLSGAFILTGRAWRLEASTDTPAPTGRVRARETLKIAGVWFGIVLFFLHGGIQVGTGQLSNNLLVESRGLDPRVVGTWISVYWAGLTVGRIVTGFVVGYLGNTGLLRVSMLGTVLGTLLLWLPAPEWLNFVGIALMGLTLGPVLPTLLADTPARAGARHSPNAVGFEIAASGVGLALLPGLAAVAAGRAGLEIIGPFLFVLAAISYVVYEWMIRVERPQR